MPTFQDLLAQACGASSIEEVPPEILSDVVEGIYGAREIPAPVQAWILQEGQRARERHARQRRRQNARMHHHLDEDAADATPVPDHRTHDPAHMVAVDEIAAKIASDDFDREIIKACRGIHNSCENFAEFAREQSEYSKAHVYKRREKLQRRLSALMPIETANFR